MEAPIKNRVAESSIITFDLEQYYDHAARSVIDIKEQLYQGFVLREKDFREYVKSHDWEQYQGKNVAIHCSSDAIIPNWAYMLLGSQLAGRAKRVVFGDAAMMENVLYMSALSKIDLEQFRDQRVIIKGCGNLPVPEFAYVEITSLLIPIVASLMYGEACSAVPLYKRKK